MGNYLEDIAVIQINEKNLKTKIMIIRIEEGRTKTHLAGKFGRSYLLIALGNEKKYIVLSMTTMLLVWVIRKWRFQCKKQEIDWKTLSLYWCTNMGEERDVGSVLAMSMRC